MSALWKAKTLKRIKRTKRYFWVNDMDLKLPIENYVLDYFVIPSLCSGHRLTLSRNPELMRRVSEGEESHPFSQTGFSIRKFLRFAQDSASGH